MASELISLCFNALFLVNLLLCILSLKGTVGKKVKVISAMVTLKDLKHIPLDYSAVTGRTYAIHIFAASQIKEDIIPISSTQCLISAEENIQTKHQEKYNQQFSLVQIPFTTLPFISSRKTYCVRDGGILEIHMYIHNLYLQIQIFSLSNS